MEAKNRDIQGLYILFYIFRVANIVSNEETQYFLKEEIYMITVKNNIRLRKEEYDGTTVVGPNGINTPFWTALTDDYDWEQLEILTDRS